MKRIWMSALILITCASLWKTYERAEPRPLEASMANSMTRPSSLKREAQKAANAVVPFDHSPHERAVLNKNAADLVRHIEANLYHPTSASEDEQIQRFATLLGPADILNLRDAVLKADARPEEKIASMYLLTLAGPHAFNALTAIAVTPLPRPLGTANPSPEASDSEERSLRITALETLDAASAQYPENKKSIVTIFEKQKDPMLSRLALISLKGLEQNRPGKLQRYFDAMTLTEK